METKIQLRIDTSLSTMHFETQEWLREIVFHREELNYQFDLITQMISSSSIDDQQHKDIFRNINALLGTLNMETTLALKLHEKSLLDAMRIIKTVKKDSFYEPHKVLSNKIKSLKEGLINLRASIYQYIDENRVQYRTEFLDFEV